LAIPRENPRAWVWGVFLLFISIKIISNQVQRELGAVPFVVAKAVLVVNKRPKKVSEITVRSLCDRWVPEGVMVPSFLGVLLFMGRLGFAFLWLSQRRIGLHFFDRKKGD
jgi:hypothetical protein